MRHFAFFLIFLLFANPAYAGINLIRDAEVENTLKNYASPVFLAAGLNPEAIKLYIVNDDSINAFVAGGQNMFINTGLINQCENANMLIGVMAHETGHIAGGHIVKIASKAEDISLEAALSMVLGAAVSIAGLPDAGMAVLAGGQHVAQRNFLSFSREQEVEADQFAINFLKETNQPLKGLLGVMQILRKNQQLQFGAVDQYAISHPLTSERISHIRSESSLESKKYSDPHKMEHERMIAKLEGFLEKPDYVLMKYTDDSVPATYARAIAYYRQPNLAKALAEIDKLLAKYPSDPFFNELKGQFYSESGKSVEAIKYYQKADKLFPGSSLIKLDLGKLLLGQNQLDSAIDALTKSNKIESSSAAWRFLAVAYGKQKNTAMANLALAEEANLNTKTSQAKAYAEKALKELPKNSPAYLRAEDLIAHSKEKKEKGKDKDEDDDDN